MRDDGKIRLTQDSKSVVHEVWVIHERLKEATNPLPGHSNRRIMTTICHVWSDEHPLRQFVVLQILVEHGEVLDLRKCIWV